MIDKASSQIRIGETLRYIREEKNFPGTMVAESILSKSQLSRIEKQGQMPNADSFIKLLHRLNVSFEEFFLLSNDDYIRARTETKHEIADILRKRSKQQLKQTLKKMDTYYDKYKDPYFHHMSCVIKATLIIDESSYDFSKTLKVLEPISNYLSSVEVWFDYEIALFTNCLYLYPLKEAIEIGNSALEKIKNNYSLFKNTDDDLEHGLLINLASYALSDEKYYHHAHGYSSAALSLPQSTHFLYSSLLAKIIHQVACYKLENTEYDKVFLVSLINGFKLLKFDDLYQQCVDFVSKHGITITIDSV